MNIHNQIKEKADLAQIYAQDGAFRTAAMRFRGIADFIDEHIQKLEDDFDAANIGGTDQ